MVAYENWLGLMDRSLSAPIAKGGNATTRTLNPPRTYTAADGSGALELKAQSLLLARNVGMHMYT